VLLLQSLASSFEPDGQELVDMAASVELFGLMFLFTPFDGIIVFLNPSLQAFT